MSRCAHARATKFKDTPLAPDVVLLCHEATTTMSGDILPVSTYGSFVHNTYREYDFRSAVPFVRVAKGRDGAGEKFFHVESCHHIHDPRNPFLREQKRFTKVGYGMMV
jgi:hypothetical protein